MHSLAFTQRGASKAQMSDTPITTRLIRPRETAARTGYTIGHITRMERAGRFPQRVRLGPNAVAHVEAEIEAWIRSRVRGGGRPVRQR
jgi:prophage regulatory protein